MILLIHLLLQQKLDCTFLSKKGNKIALIRDLNEIFGKALHNTNNF